MENALNEKLIDLITKLGEEAAADARFVALKASTENYMADERLKKLIEEYNIQQSALATVSGQGTEGGEGDIQGMIEKRLDELYTAITENESYKAYAEAKEAYDEFYGEIVEELQFRITGVRPCTHDCHSCGGHCHE